MKEVILSYGNPFISFSTNDAHLFCLAAMNLEQKNFLSVNALNLGFSITKTKYGHIYDSYLKVKQEKIIDHIEIEKEIFENINQFSNFLFTTLTKKYYIILDLDVSKINAYNFKEQVTIHSPIVIGIDLKNEKVLLGDFFDFKHYSVQWIPLNEVYNAYEVIEKYMGIFPKDGNDDWIRTTSLIQSNKLKLEFNLNGFIDNIQEYLNPADVKFSSKQVSSFHLVSHRLQGIGGPIEETELLEVGSGISIYNFLRKHLKEEFEKGEYRTVQSCSLLVSHFKILKDAVLFIENKLLLDGLNQDIIEIMINYSKQLEAICLKNYVQKSHKNKIGKCLSLIDTIEKVEQSFLADLILKLKLIITKRGTS